MSSLVLQVVVSRPACATFRRRHFVNDRTQARKRHVAPMVLEPSIVRHTSRHACLALVLTGPDTKTLPVAIAEYGGEDINYWSLSAAAAIGIMLPIVAFMMALQRHLVRGLAFGAVKG